MVQKIYLLLFIKFVSRISQPSTPDATTDEPNLILLSINSVYTANHTYSNSLQMIMVLHCIKITLTFVLTYLDLMLYTNRIASSTHQTYITDEMCFRVSQCSSRQVRHSTYYNSPIIYNYYIFTLFLVATYECLFSIFYLIKMIPTILVDKF